MGPLGWWIVMIATGLAVILQLGGVWLWWQRKTIGVHTRQGWRRIAFDLHHSVGVLGVVIMLTLAVTGIGRVVMRELDPSRRHPFLRSAMIRLHSADGFPAPIKVLYTLGSAGFLVQGATGIVMWSKPSRRKCIPP